MISRLHLCAFLALACYGAGAYVAVYFGIKLAIPLTLAAVWLCWLSRYRGPVMMPANGDNGGAKDTHTHRHHQTDPEALQLFDHSGTLVLVPLDHLIALQRRAAADAIEPQSGDLPISGPEADGGLKQLARTDVPLRLLPAPTPQNTAHK